MKKLFCLLLIVLTLYSLAACGSEKDMGTSSPTIDPTQGSSASESQATEEESKTPNSEPQQNTDGIDIDLTKLSSTMVYSEVYGIMLQPEDYIGKTIKMEGQFSYYEDPDTKNQYFACIIADATACCSQGLEFVLTGEHIYPDDYPEIYSEITVTGTFEVYEENGYKFCHLINAEFSN